MYEELLFKYICYFREKIGLSKKIFLLPEESKLNVLTLCEGFLCLLVTAVMNSINLNVHFVFIS